ncbi:MAG: SurA N-terminal domain-containing protein [Deltaproteobacteria bacterium]|nr:SurA N-terminal domain-containing protein [Deltaproteobacteria bacterium]
MLEALRKRQRSFVIIAAFFIIILVFIFWGVGPTGKKAPKGVVATVDGVGIPVDDYTALYRRQIDYYNSVFKGGIPKDVLEKLNLRKKTVDMLVDRALILNDAGKRKVRVSPAEIQKKIASIPAFQKDGAFDRELYFSTLRANRLKPADFEKSIEDELIIERIQDAATGSVRVSDEDIRQAFEKEIRQVSFEYVKIDSRRLVQEVTATDDEAKKYFEEKASAFSVPAKVRAFYAYADKAVFKKGVKIPRSALRDFYDKNIAGYRKPGRVWARHILIRSDKSAADKAMAKNDARQKAMEILKAARKGGDFAALAKKYSEDPGSRDKGGDLGWFGRGMMVRTFEDAAFSLKKGEVSEPVETEYGFHIIKAEGVEKEGATPFEEAQIEIERLMTEEEAGKRARTAMTELHDVFKQNVPVERLKEEAAKRGVKTQETGFFTAADENVELARDKKLKESVFAIDANGVSGVVDVTGRLYVIKVMDRVKEHIPPFAEIADKVKETVKKDKAKKLAGVAAEELLKKIKETPGALAAAAKGSGFKAEKTNFFAFAQGFIPVIGVFVGDRGDMSELKKGELYPKVVPHEDSFYVFKLADVKEAPQSEFDRRKDEIKDGLLARKKEEATKKWLKELRDGARVEIHEEVL